MDEDWEPRPLIEELLAFCASAADAAVRSLTGQAAAWDQVAADLRTRRSQISCRRCTGLHLLSGSGLQPEGPCHCLRPCDRPGCLATDELQIPDALP